MTPAPGPTVIGIDLGGTNCQLGVLDAADTLVGRHRMKTRAELGADGVVGRLVEGVDAACADAGLRRSSIDAVGVAVCGAVDIPTGVVLEAVNLEWNDYPLGEVLGERLGCRVVIDNDVNGAVWGEYRAGAGRGCRDLFGIWVGTGVGGGLILDGRLHHGVLHTAGEIGHTIITADGPEGARSVEDHCGRSSMRSILTGLLPEHPDSALAALGDPAAIGTREIDAAFEQGDPLALRVVGRAAGLLGLAIANVVTLLAVDRVVVGGGMTEALGDPFMAMIRASFDREVFPDRCRACQIVTTELAADAGLLGAALLARERL